MVPPAKRLDYKSNNFQTNDQFPGGLARGGWKDLNPPHCHVLLSCLALWSFSHILVEQNEGELILQTDLNVDNWSKIVFQANIFLENKTHTKKDL